MSEENLNTTKESEISELVTKLQKLTLTKSDKFEETVMEIEDISKKYQELIANLTELIQESNITDVDSKLGENLGRDLSEDDSGCFYLCHLII